MYWDINYPYIGQTNRDIKIRSKAHINSMRRGDHCNYKVQNMYNKYNENPTFEILTKCNEIDLHYLEEFYIKDFDSINNGLNILSGGYSVGRGINNPASKYSKEKLLEAFRLLSDSTMPFKEITKHTGIPKDTLTKISTGVQHSWLHEEQPDLWEKIKNISTKERYTNSACAKGQGKSYLKILSPEGVIYDVTNTLEFSKEHNLPNGNLCSVLLGKRNSVKGWKGIK